MPKCWVSWAGPNVTNSSWLAMAVQGLLDHELSLAFLLIFSPAPVDASTGSLYWILQIHCPPFSTLLCVLRLISCPLPSGCLASEGV